MRRKWNKSEDKFLKESVGKITWKECAGNLNRSVRSVYSRVNTLGLKHPKKFIAKITKEKWLSGEMEGCKKSWYTKGSVPANKGKKQSEFMTPEGITNSAKTRFKKSHNPHNHKPVGHTRVDKDGYTYIKVAEPNVFKLKHRVLWEEAHGPIPRGSIIQFVNGDKSDIRLENLQIISREKQIGQNTIHRYPNEVKQLIKLQHKLTKKINNYAKK